MGSSNAYAQRAREKEKEEGKRRKRRKKKGETDHATRPLRDCTRIERSDFAGLVTCDTMVAFTYCIQSNQPVQISYCRTMATRAVAILLCLLCYAAAAPRSSSAVSDGEEATPSQPKAITVQLPLDAAVRFHEAAGGAFRILKKERRRSNYKKASDLPAAEQQDRALSPSNLRFLTSGDNSCTDQLNTCQVELDNCREGKAAEADDNAPSYLYVQMAQTCKLKQKTDGRGRTHYELSPKDMDDDTYSFTDRPHRIAGTIPTKQFVKDFGTTFSIESGGRPNGVVTFRHADAKSFEGPLISVFVEAARHKDSGKYVYELTQSEEQEEVNALRDFFREEEGGSNDPDGVGVVEYEMCSIFIDASNECDPANVDSCKMGNCVWKEYKSDCEACQCYVSGYGESKAPPYFCEKSARTGNKAKCVDKRPNGDICHMSWQCKGGYCRQDGFCASLKDNGSKCSKSEECWSNYCASRGGKEPKCRLKIDPR